MNIESLKSSLIVSCQAPKDSPLHNPMIIAAMAKAAVNHGVKGVRIDTPDHIKAVREQIGNIPIIGLWKQQIPGYEVYITPRWEDAEAIQNADIIAIDATPRKRPSGETLKSLISRIHGELGKLVMADIDTLESAVGAAEAGADIIGTTLYGYTPQTQHLSPPGFSLLKELVQQVDIPIICEGGIATPAMAKEALELGAYAVVVGAAITGIDIQVQAFQSVIG